MKPTSQPEIVWRPQAGPQKALVDCPFAEILFGGARGGGKTDGILGKYALKAQHYGADFNAVFFRKEMPQADDLIERAKEIYLPIGGQWFEQKKQFVLPGGGRIRFRPLESIADAQKYQGQNLTDAAVEEAGNYPSPAPIDMLFGALRSKNGVPIQMILTANPGGPGHQWIKHRFIDPAPMGFTPLQRTLPNGAQASHRHVYIPSRVTDNRILMASDPGYLDRLQLVGSAELVRAWLLGDWSAISGAYFPEFSIDRHVVAPIALPAHWSRSRAMDWGSARPFSVGWFAVAEDDLPQFPRGALILYREWYGASAPNVGLKLTAEEVADGIKARDDAKRGVIDPAAFKEDGGPSIAERMARRGVRFMPADNSRLAGWDQVRARLKGEDGRPMLYFFATCPEMIRTLPALQHDDLKPEDLDSDGEDHAADMLRYQCMSRPYVPPEKRTVPTNWGLNAPAPTFNDALAAHERHKRTETKRI